MAKWSGESEGTGGERLVAYIVAREGEREAVEKGCGSEAVLMRCRRSMPAHQIPSQVVVLQSLPLTHSGKTDRSKLPAPPPPEEHRGEDDGDGEGIEGDGWLRTTTEVAVASVWREALKISRPLGPFDHFFELGGRSISCPFP